MQQATALKLITGDKDTSVEKIEREFDQLFEETKGKIDDLDKFTITYIGEHLSSKLGYSLDMIMLEKGGYKVWSDIKSFRRLIIFDYALNKAEEMQLNEGVLNRKFTFESLMDLTKGLPCHIYVASGYGKLKGGHIGHVIIDHPWIEERLYKLNAKIENDKYGIRAKYALHEEELRPILLKSLYQTCDHWLLDEIGYDTAGEMRKRRLSLAEQKKLTGGCYRQGNYSLVTMEEKSRFKKILGLTMNDFKTFYWDLVLNGVIDEDLKEKRDMFANLLSIFEQTSKLPEDLNHRSRVSKQLLGYDGGYYDRFPINSVLEYVGLTYKMGRRVMSMEPELYLRSQIASNKLGLLSVRRNLDAAVKYFKEQNWQNCTHEKFREKANIDANQYFGVYIEYSRLVARKTYGENDDLILLSSLGYSHEEIERSKIRHYNLSKFKQDWFRSYMKGFLARQSRFLSAGSLGNLSRGLDKLSLFIDHSYQDHKINGFRDFKREFILDFVDWLYDSKQSFGQETKKASMPATQKFIEDCVEQGVLDAKALNFIRKSDYRGKHSKGKKNIRVIDHYVWEQIIANLDKFPKEYLRLFIILKNTGIRITNLCTLKRDILVREGDGNYAIQFHVQKTDNETVIPLLEQETVDAIQEQQKFVEEEWGDKTEYLFANPRFRFAKHQNRYVLNKYGGRPVTSGTIWSTINRFIVECDIRDINGKTPTVTPHMFRHTLATKMADNDVDAGAIRDYLGHVSFQMTERYIHRSLTTRRKYFDQYQQNVIGVNGNVLDQDQIAEIVGDGEAPDYRDLKTLRMKIQAQVVPNGLCTLSAKQAKCPYDVHHCYTCGDFYTDPSYLKNFHAELKQTSTYIADALKLGQNRVVEMNEKKKTSIENII